MNAVIAFEETGLILFAPQSTKVGDLVCQFPDSDVLVLPHLNWYDGSNQVARGVNFLAAPPTVTADLCGKVKRFCDKDEERGILLTFRLPRPLMEMCKPSETPNGNHNIPVEETGREEIVEMTGSLTT